MVSWSILIRWFQNVMEREKDCVNETKTFQMFALHDTESTELMSCSSDCLI